MSPINQKIQRFLQSTWPPKAASALLLILFSWWAFANILPFFVEKEITPAPQVVKTTKTPEQFSLKNLDLFGEPEKNKAVNKTSEAKQTKLNLTLRGVLATEDPKQGIAQIQNAKKQERHFSVSDSVFGQATLEEIHADHVILLHNGRYETLLLPEKFLNTKHFAATKLIKEQKRIVSSYRNLIHDNNGEELMKLFGFMPVFRNGGFKGFLVKALGEKGREMMETLGVEHNDLITVVNGLRLSETLEASEKLKDLKTAKSVDVIIERHGREIPFHFDFDMSIDKIANLPKGKTQQDIAREKAIARPSFKNTEAFQVYKQKQLERTTGVREEVEFED